MLLTKVAKRGAFALVVIITAPIMSCIYVHQVSLPQDVTLRIKENPEQYLVVVVDPDEGNVQEIELEGGAFHFTMPSIRSGEGLLFGVIPVDSGNAYDVEVIRIYLGGELAKTLSYNEFMDLPQDEEGVYEFCGVD